MKDSILKAAVCAMSLVFVSGLALIPARTVKADADDTIKVGETKPVDFEEDDQWFFEYDSSKDTEGKYVEFSSTGSTDVKVYLIKDNKVSGPTLGEDDNSGDEYNFKLAKYLDPGVYYFWVRPYDVFDISSKNDTKVTLKDISNKTVVAKINSTTFPDAVFRDFVDSKYDVRNDGVLTKDEVIQVKEMDISSKNITSLKGIEYFGELTSLACNNTKLTTLDLTGNPKLDRLSTAYVYDLKSIDLSKCTRLTSLTCRSCKLETLTLTQCKSLDFLACNDNPLKELNLSGLKYLAYLYCEDCQIKTLNISGCRSLEKLDCDNNKIQSIDASTASSLVELRAANNELRTVSLNKSVEVLEVQNNANLEKLDLTGCSRLREINCSGTKITKIDISDCPKLIVAYDVKYKNADGTEYSTVINAEGAKIVINPGTTIECTSEPGENVVEVNEANFPDSAFRFTVNKFDLDGDGYLNKLEIRTITSLNLDGRYMSTLKGIEYFTELEVLSCFYNNLTELDLSNNTKLTVLNCSRNPLTKLNVSKCTALRELYCSTTSLEKLDLTNNANLVFIDCSIGKLSKLDLSRNTKLETLICSGNQLTTLDISKNKDLEYMECYCNKLTKLDLLNNPILLNDYKNFKPVEATCNGTKILTYENENTGSMLIVDKGTKIISAKPTATPTATPTSKPTTKPAAVSLTLDKKTANLVCGKTLTLKATLKGSTSKITWKSSNTKVATVDSKGKITAKMAGEVTITATAAGKSAKCKVTVLYKDVTNTKDFWYAPTNYLTAKGVVKGYDKQTKFKPANKCTRAQMVTFIWRLQGEPKPKAKTCKFKDVKKSDYFYKACIWGNENHIVEGYKDGTFGPQIVCARKHAVTFLWRLANKPKPSSTKNKFKDVKKKDYFYQATLWASEKKILAGYDDGTFRPNGDCLRRQMVTFLYKYDKYVNGKG